MALPLALPLPSQLDSFTVAAWSSVCRDAGFDVLTEPQQLKEGNFILVINEKCAQVRDEQRGGASGWWLAGWLLADWLRLEEKGDCTSLVACV